MLPGFHPLVSGWFEARFGSPTEPQAAGWPEILAGKDVLISAPTGSGKTLAAFLSGLDALFREGLDGALPDETRILYVSPLKALSNDIEKNLREPLAGLREAALAAGLRPPAIRAAVRTGDTPSSRRQAMLRRPPHVLVTTPESLYLLLTSEKGRRSLATVRKVIVDEIHAVARDKRGSHLSLSLERLEALCDAAPAAHRALGHGEPGRGGRALPGGRRPGAAGRGRLRDRRRGARPRPRPGRGDPGGRALLGGLQGAVGRDLRPARRRSPARTGPRSSS